MYVESYRGCDIYVGNNGSRSLKIIGHHYIATFLMDVVITYAVESCIE